MKQYNYLQAIFMSFYSRRLYRDVVTNWGASVVLYLFFILAISWFITSLSMQPKITSSFTQFANTLAPQIPEIDIKNGIVKTPENKPYVMQDLDTKEVIAIIDTSGKYANLQGSKAKILVTKNVIFYRDNEDPGLIKMREIPPSLSLAINPTKVKETVIHWVGWTWLILFPFLLLVSFIYRLFQAVCYAVLGKIFAAVSSTSLHYVNILQLSMVTITPVIVLGTIFDLVSVRFNHQWLFYFMLAMGYLIFAIMANKQKE